MNDTAKSTLEHALHHARSEARDLEDRLKSIEIDHANVTAKHQRAVQRISDLTDALGETKARVPA